MKLFLTSGGITNDTLARELEDLTGKKFEDLKIAFIPTAAFCEAGNKDWLVLDMYRLIERGAKVDIVDIAHLSHADILQRLEWADVIFVGGGNTFYLSYWMQEARLFDILPGLLKNRVYAGISAGSMIASKTIRTASQAYKSQHLYDEAYEEFGPAGQSSAKSMEWVDFAFRPHLNSRYFPGVNIDTMQVIADRFNTRVYVMDDQCAVKVEDHEVSIVGEGESYILESKEAR